MAPASPYAGQQTREIKALSATQTLDLQAGKGLEMAKAAELNGYPGPQHTLELGTQLNLSDAQRQATQALLAHHKAQARELGAQLVQAERELDAAFASHQITEAQLTSFTQRLGVLQGALRQSHLQAHLQQTTLLRPEQISRYAQLRGYSAAPGTPAPTVHPHEMK